MPIWSAATIQRFSNEGEEEVAKELNCILNRVSLEIVNGTSVYSLPNEAYAITRVTWKGKKVDPMPFNEMRRFGLNNPLGEPLWYIFNHQGRNTIKFFYTPNEDIAQALTDLWGSSIRTSVIIEFYQLPDFSTIYIPTYLRRRLLKYFVQWKCFSVEGKGQNIKNAKIAQEKFQFYLAWIKRVYAGHFTAKIPVLGPGITGASYLAPPVLPVDKFGQSGEF